MKANTVLLQIQFIEMKIQCLLRVHKKHCLAFAKETVNFGKPNLLILFLCFLFA